MSVITSGPAAFSTPANVTTRSVSRRERASPIAGTLETRLCTVADGSHSTREDCEAMTK